MASNIIACIERDNAGAHAPIWKDECGLREDLGRLDNCARKGNWAYRALVLTGDAFLVGSVLPVRVLHKISKIQIGDGLSDAPHFCGLTD